MEDKNEKPTSARIQCEKPIYKKFNKKGKSMDNETIIDLNFEGQRLLFENSKRFDYERFTIMYLDEYNDDYLNIAINLKAKNIDEFKRDFSSIKKIMNSINRKASLVIHNTELISKIKCNEFGLEISDDSVWLMIKNLKNVPRYKSDILVNVSKITSNEIEYYPDKVKKGFLKSNENDPYDGLSKSVVDAIKRSCYIKSPFTTEHYVARHNNNIIGTITIMYEKEIAYIYNVTTDINYRNKGVCKELMSYVLSRLNELGIDQAVLQTEKGFYPERIYKNLGFKELFRAIKYTEK